MTEHEEDNHLDFRGRRGKGICGHVVITLIQLGMSIKNYIKEQENIDKFDNDK